MATCFLNSHPLAVSEAPFLDQHHPFLDPLSSLSSSTLVIKILMFISELRMQHAGHLNDVALAKLQRHAPRLLCQRTWPDHCGGHARSPHRILSCQLVVQDAPQGGVQLDGRPGWQEGQTLAGQIVAWSPDRPPGRRSAPSSFSQVTAIHQQCNSDGQWAAN
eukprot:1152281-Pelagomonas_calceolata.AAC.3